jgi:hypothetical protein
MGDYLQSAAMNPGEYEYEAEARETRSRCIRRRRGHAINALDTFKKVLPPKVRAAESGRPT